MDASSIISSSVHSEDPDIKWVTKLLIQSNAHILEKLKNDSALEKENKELKKKLFKQRVYVAELQRKLIAQQEEEKIREENLINVYNDLKEDMQTQSEKTNSLIQDLMDMVKNQAKP